MTAPNFLSKLPKINIDSIKNNRKLLLYIVFGFSAVSIIMLLALIIWMATKDNVPVTPPINNLTVTPSPTSVVGPTIISEIPIVESTKFVYLKSGPGSTTGDIVSYDLKNNTTEDVSTNLKVKKIISISPNNKYLFIQIVNDLGTDEYGIFTLENKSYNIVEVTTFTQTFWASNDFVNFLYTADNDSTFSLDSFDARENTQSQILTFPKNLVNEPLVSRDIKYLIGIDNSDDSYHFIDLVLKTNKTIDSLDLISGNYFLPIQWNKENKLIYVSSTGIFMFNPLLLNSSQLVSLSTVKDKLEVRFLNYNEDQKSMLFMLDGYIYRSSINTGLTKEVLNINNRSNLKLVDLSGNGQNFFVMENYDGMMEVYNIKNSKLATICDTSCKNPVWFY